MTQNSLFADAFPERVEVPASDATKIAARRREAVVWRLDRDAEALAASVRTARERVARVGNSKRGRTAALAALARIERLSAALRAYAECCRRDTVPDVLAGVGRKSEIEMLLDFEALPVPRVARATVEAVRAYYVERGESRGCDADRVALAALDERLACEGDPVFADEAFEVFERIVWTVSTMCFSTTTKDRHGACRRRRAAYDVRGRRRGFVAACRRAGR